MRLGFRNKQGEIQLYKTKPDPFITEMPEWSSFESFYGTGVGGRCPTMQEQEERLLRSLYGEKE